MKKGMKKLVSLMLAAIMVISLVAFSTTVYAEADPDFKVGVILVGDETEGYSMAHITGLKEAAKELGLDDSQIIWKYKVPEDSSCYDAAVDLVGQGCKLVISNSYGHQTYMVQAAMEYPDTTFISMTGDFAAISGCDNFKNAFTNIYEARYVSGVVAGLKLKELLDDGTLTEETQPDSFDADGNVKIGYVGAFSYAEVVSGYTAFYLGVKSIVPNTVMEVKYTNSWFDIDKEGAAAEALIANGAVIIGQHADSTGAPAATQKLLDSGKICYSVGYNIDMLETAPTAALTSATNNWSVYYKYALETAMNGGTIDTDWSKGFDEDAVGITALGESCAEGTEEYVNDIESKLKDGSLQVFDTSTFTVDGQEVTTAECDMSFMDFTTDPATVVYQGDTVEAIEDGHFSESTFRSAPYFTLRIDGITEDAEAVE
ncbi:MAG: BMP family ABC transporter substrate-binding protein [Clostridia bacterium]|nr:BMP family ABC transporter substrate-binding protein [Clostridia bacterium]MDY5556104.1 BMP family ABC transporter substrate-binding protein [Blautia sp.]